jgi:hypothetical protein
MNFLSSFIAGGVKNMMDPTLQAPDGIHQLKPVYSFL